MSFYRLRSFSLNFYCKQYLWKPNNSFSFMWQVIFREWRCIQMAQKWKQVVKQNDVSHCVGCVYYTFLFDCKVYVSECKNLFKVYLPTLPMINVSCKRAFSKMKIIKNWFGSNMNDIDLKILIHVNSVRKRYINYTIFVQLCVKLFLGSGCHIAQILV